jgi:hypothetical protein
VGRSQTDGTKPIRTSGCKQAAICNHPTVPLSESAKAKQGIHQKVLRPSYSASQFGLETVQIIVGWFTSCQTDMYINTMASDLNYVLITNCSATKKLGTSQVLRASALRSGSMGNVVREWNSLVRKGRNWSRARDLYRGSGASAARKAAEESGASWYVVSAGIGLVHSSRRVPVYDLSISPGDGRSYVLDKVNNGAVPAPEEWWQALSGVAGGVPHPIRRLVKRRKDALIVVALSHPYLQMVAPDLTGLSEKDINRVRIITLHRNAVPEELRHAVMPYDSRLNGKKSPFRGPMSSFVQRAARHFLKIASRDACEVPARVHAGRVRKALSHLSKPRQIHRRQVSDATLSRMVRRIQSEGANSSHAGLRRLRDEFHVACGQSRFSSAWKRMSQLQ